MLDGPRHNIETKIEAFAVIPEHFYSSSTAAVTKAVERIHESGRMAFGRHHRTTGAPIRRSFLALARAYTGGCAGRMGFVENLIEKAKRVDPKFVIVLDYQIHYLDVMVGVVGEPGDASLYGWQSVVLQEVRDIPCCLVPSCLPTVPSGPTVHPIQEHTYQNIHTITAGPHPNIRMGRRRTCPSRAG